MGDTTSVAGAIMCISANSPIHAANGPVRVSFRCWLDSMLFRMPNREGLLMNIFLTGLLLALLLGGCGREPIKIGDRVVNRRTGEPYTVIFAGNAMDAIRMNSDLAINSGWRLDIETSGNVAARSGKEPMKILGVVDGTGAQIDTTAIYLSLKPDDVSHVIVIFAIPSRVELGESYAKLGSN